MSLTVKVNFNGIKVDTCILQVGVLNISEDHKKVTFCALFKATEVDEPFDKKYYECPYDEEGASPVAQAYTYLSTLEEFN